MKTLIATLAFLFATTSFAAEQEVGFTGLSLKEGEMVVIKLHTLVPQVHSFVVKSDVAVDEKVAVRVGDVKPGNYRVDVTVRKSPLSNEIVFERSDVVTIQ